MKWSMRLGRFAGIDVHVHVTFLLLLGWVAWSNFSESQSWAGAAIAVGFILALFVCVVLHEFGHALTARRFGIRTRDITLLPIGGVARLERMPDDPKQELAVALAGPAVNVVIAIGLWVALAATDRLDLQGLSVTGGPFLEWLMGTNVALALFNMIPAFPMDGGRVLRALLATRLDYARATRIAAMIGQGMALLLGFAGLFWLDNPILVFIALFVWIGAGQEANMAEMRSSLSGIPVRAAMTTDFRALAPRDTLSRAVDLTLETSQKDYPVVEDGRVLGMLLQADLVRALGVRDVHTAVSDVMRRDCGAVEAREMLDVALSRMRGVCSSVPVHELGRLVGLLSLDKVGEFLSIRGALGRSAPGGRGALQRQTSETTRPSINT